MCEVDLVEVIGCVGSPNGGGPKQHKDKPSSPMHSPMGADSGDPGPNQERDDVRGWE